MKKLVSALLASAMVLTLAACGQPAPATGSSAPSGSSGASAPAASGDVIKIGDPQPLTGTNALVGDAAQKGAELAVAEINAAGGVLGHKLELVNYDDQGSPEEAVKIATKMIEVDKVNWICGSLISSAMLATGPYYEEAGIITLGCGLSSTWMTQGWKYVWRACPNSGMGMPTLANYMKTLGIEKISIFQGQDDASASGADDMRKACEAAGIKVLISETYVDGDTDFSGQAIKIVNSKPDAVFTSTYSVAQSSFAKQLRQAGYKSLVFNKETLSIDNIAAAGDAANYYAFMFPYVTYKDVKDCDDENMAKFLTAFQKKFGQMPYHDCAYRAYDSVYVMAAAAEKANSIESKDMIEALGKINDFKGLGGTYDFTKGDQEGIHEFKAWVVVDQKIESFDKWLKAGGYDQLKKG